MDLAQVRVDSEHCRRCLAFGSRLLGAPIHRLGSLQQSWASGRQSEVRKLSSRFGGPFGFRVIRLFYSGGSLVSKSLGWLSLSQGVDRIVRRCVTLLWKGLYRSIRNLAWSAIAPQASSMISLKSAVTQPVRTS